MTEPHAVDHENVEDIINEGHCSRNVHHKSKTTERIFVSARKAHALCKTHSLFRAAILLANYKDFLCWLVSVCNEQWREEREMRGL